VNGESRGKKGKKKKKRETAREKRKERNIISSDGDETGRVHFKFAGVEAKGRGPEPENLRKGEGVTRRHGKKNSHRTC